MKPGPSRNQSETLLLSILFEGFQSGTAGGRFARIDLNLAHEKAAFEFGTAKTALPGFSLQAVKYLQGCGCFSGFESNGCANQPSLEFCRFDLPFLAP